MANFYFESSIRDSVEDHYHVREQIGRGGTSIVRRCFHKKTRLSYALKTVQKRSKVPQKVLSSEVHALLTVDHPNVIKLKEIYESENEVHLVLELVTGGELFDRIIESGFFSEKVAANVVKQLLEALAYIHARNIMHRDIKPENLLYKDESSLSPIKLADFGLSKVMSSEVTMQTVCGTPGYVAPEVLLGKDYGLPVDIWSVGVVAYIMLCGFEPFYSDRGDTAIYARILKCDYEFLSPYWDDVSLNAKDLISKLIVLDPRKRLTAKEALNHPWVQGRAAKSDHMAEALRYLKEYTMARRKLKGGIYAVMACDHFVQAAGTEGKRLSCSSV
ncbi:calcium/calmodulin-dependent protein kinase type IV-like [Corticium candelabrum]|uniref:calcium/calmodulin-dependent protein kinase type IV-like n=1 Tax=Corticium candelabrum TaxID=121492 RepID=UPI002E25979E|nr:calcium/calmodulin-dependent protein kinase type IV-like [Corticium candelabrum]